MTVDVTLHARALREHGYTIISSQVSESHVAELNKAADSALNAVSSAISRGVKPAHTLYNQYVRAARCFYAWDQTCRDLLEHGTIHKLGEALLGRMRLYDMTVLEALPKPAGAELKDFDWHRDFQPSSKEQRPEYLWVFTCLTDVTNQNGATWVLPGSQKDASIKASSSITKEKPANAIQLTAKAGDMIAINPAMLHAVGENQTQFGRRLALVGLCRSDRPPLLNHWAMSSPEWRAEMGIKTRNLMYTEDLSVGEIWDVLPDNWVVSQPGFGRRARRLANQVHVAARTTARRLINVATNAR